MTIKSDRWIKDQCKKNKMIDPFIPKQVREVKGRKVISYGCSSYGYDIRISDEFKYLRSEQVCTGLDILDPKKPNRLNWRDEVCRDWCLIPGNSMVLARSVEYFKIPKQVLAVCLGKSTYARLGLIVNVTPLEPEWEGHLTIELSNTTPLPIIVYPNEGIAQIIFHHSDDVCSVSYADKKGKYQKQVGVQGALL